MWREHARSWLHLCFWPGFRAAEQRIGRRAVSGCPITVGCNAGDFGFEAGNPRGEFGLRVWGQILGSEAARCIAPGPRQIGFIHQCAASQGNGLAVNP
jgi:hypothetical protein